MSEQALNMIAEQFANEVILGDKDELDRLEVRNRLMEELDVIESTANTYLRDYCKLRKETRQKQYITDVVNKQTGEVPEVIKEARQKSVEADGGSANGSFSGELANVDQEVGDVKRVNVSAWDKDESDTHDEYACRDCGAYPALTEKGTDEEFCIHCGAIHFNGLPVLEDVGHPLVPDVDSGYIRRRMDRGKKTDVENVSWDMGSPDFATLLVGETGVGKDFLVKYICAKTNRPLVRVNFGEGVLYEDLVGGFEPGEDTPEDVVEEARELEENMDISFSEAVQAMGQQSNFEFKPGFLYEAVENGYTFLADEINAAGPEATMPLHGVTEDEDSRHLTVRQTGEVIDPHDQFCFVGTMNPPHYPGTKPLNEAFESRFWTEEMTWLPPKAEANMMFQQTPLTKDSQTEEQFVDNLTDALEKLRVSYKEQDIVTPISHRHARQIGKQAKRMSPKEAAKKILLASADAGDENTIDKTLDMHLN